MYENNYFIMNSHLHTYLIIAIIKIEQAFHQPPSRFAREQKMRGQELFALKVIQLRQIYSYFMELA